MGKTRILVVDDEEEICQLTLQFLVKKDYHMFTATSGEEAIKVVNKEHPNIVLLDVRLGGESGLEVLKRIKDIDEKIKVIMVTALGDETTIQQAKALGADDYITKPFTAGFLNNLLLEKISNLGAEHRRAMQNEEKNS
jgi:DNA-binding response OmpR family regulator